MLNRYCDRLAIPVPKVEDHAPQGSVKLFHTMVIALLEHGGPMPLEAVAQRLQGAGVGDADDLRTRLLKAWHGSEPVYRNPDGMFAVSLTSPELEWVLLVTGLLAPSRVEVERQPVPAPRGDDEPLAEEELRVLLRTPAPAGLSELRIAAAALEVAGRPMTDRDLDAFASAVVGEPRIGLARVAAGLRRAIVRALPVDAEPRAFGVLDLRSRAIRSVAAVQRDRVEEELSEFDLLAGLGVRKLLYVLRLDADRWQIADLAPPHKTRRLNRAGRTLRITPELLIAGTIGVTRPLGDPARIAGYVAAGDDRRLMRRLEADLKSLYAFYQYGTLHRHVRLRWGFLDELLPVSWPHPGDPDILDVLRDSAERRAPVALVLGSAPGWRDPWSRARRYVVLAHDAWWLHVRGPSGLEERIPVAEVQAIRLAAVG